MPGPVIWGPNNISTNLQNQIQLATGEVLNSNGPKNYLAYNNFDSGLTTGWSLGTTGTLTNGIPTGTPTFGSGANVNLGISTTTTNPIAGRASFVYGSGTATTAGDMVASDPLALEIGDQAKVLTAKFYYNATNPTNANYSGTSSNSFGIACYDVTNSSWLPVVGNFAMTQSSGTGIAVATMQTNLTTASIRFVIYNVTASAGATGLNLDRFFLGPQTAPIGAVRTDLGSIQFTPSGSWVSNTTYAAKLGRDGDRLVGSINLALTGAPTSTTLTLNLPFTIDTTKLSGGTASNQDLGEVNIVSGGVGYFGKLRYNNTTSVTVIYANSTFSSVTQASPGTFGNGDTINCTLDIPISGWSSNVQMSNDTDTRVVAAQIGMTTLYAVGANAVIKYDTVASDTAGAYSASTGLYTAPVSGFYRLSVIGTLSAAWSPYIKINGVSKGVLFGTPVNNTASGSLTCRLSAGDTLGIYSDAAGNVYGGTGVGFINQFDIERLSGPAVIAATESVNCSYQATGGQTVNSTPATIIYNTKIYDTHNAMNAATGVYTVPVSGKYHISHGTLTNGAVYSTTQDVEVNLVKNGSVNSWLGRVFGNGANINMSVSGSNTVSLLAGDLIRLDCYSAVSNSLASPVANYISIDRVGN